MPHKDQWDWPSLMYIATVLLRRTEKQFWRMRPRKLNALAKAHVKMKGGGQDTQTQGSVPTSNGKKTGFIDQIF